MSLTKFVNILMRRSVKRAFSFYQGEALYMTSPMRCVSCTAKFCVVKVCKSVSENRVAIVIVNLVRRNFAKQNSVSEPPMAGKIRI